MNVNFYNYQGRPNEVPKNLGSVVAGYNINLITDNFPCLTVNIELSVNVDANYITFRYPNAQGRLYSWFVDDITKFENIFTYHCTLDVLATYWNDIKAESQMIERSSSLTPSGSMQDALWKTGKALKVSTTVASGSTATFSSSLTGRHSVIVTGGRSNIGEHTMSVTDLNDYSNSRMLHVYALDQSQTNKLGEWLWSTSPTAILSKWLLNPLDAIVASKVYPFSINRGTLDADYTLESELAMGDALVVMGEDNKAMRLLNSNVRLFLGSFTMEKPYGDFRDYPPYTSYKMWLPYVGLTDFPAYEFYGKTFYVNYHVSLPTGATIITFSTSSTGNNPTHTISTQLGYDLPLTKTGMDAVAGQLVQAGTNIALMASGIPALGGSVTQTASTVTTTIKEYNPENPRQIMSKRVETVDIDSATGKDDTNSVGHSVMGMAQTAINAFMTPAPSQIVGNASSNPYRNLPLYAILYTYTCEAVDDAGQKTKYGRLVMKTAVLNTLNGFCKVNMPVLPMKGMTHAVYNRLMSIMADGFYINN